MTPGWEFEELRALLFVIAYRILGSEVKQARRYGERPPPDLALRTVWIPAHGAAAAEAIAYV